MKKVGLLIGVIAVLGACSSPAKTSDSADSLVAEVDSVGMEIDTMVMEVDTAVSNSL
ncbi:MAG: hypothetical protein ACFHWX_21580 [Bacteroidota bacterium]